MGGELTLESTYGEGSEFWFEIEQGIVDPEPIGDFEKIRKNYHRQVDVYKEGFEAPDAHILVVDDVPLNLVVIKGLLKNSGINIDTAESGAEGIEKMKSEHYDIVFLDHMMPEMDGIETLSQIKADPDIDSYSIPIVALTANAISGAEKMYRDSGFTDYLTKPIDPAKLEKMILNYLPPELIKPRSSGERGLSS